MHVTVIGAGAVGGVLAALLDRAGHDVSVTARGEHAEVMRATGLLMIGGWGEHRARVRVVDRAPDATDLVIVATKAHDTEAAVAAAAPPPGCAVLVMQNGLAGEAVARAQLPDSPVAVGLALFAASLVAPGVVEVTGPAPLVLGGDVAAITAFADVLREALPAEVAVVADIAGAQWTKLVINQVNALPAITGWSVQECVADDRLRGIMAAGMVEVALVGDALGVNWQPIGPVDATVVHPLLSDGTAGLAAGEELARMLARGMGDVPNPASMLQSIRRGRTTEVDAINGAIVDYGARVGVATPVNAGMRALVHEVERAGAFLTVEQVGERLSPESP